jgi:hypothetical protein
MPIVIACRANHDTVFHAQLIANTTHVLLPDCPHFSCLLCVVVQTDVNTAFKCNLYPDARVQCRYEQTGGRIYVCEIVPGSPSDESREVRVGDILLSVDGQRVQGMQLDSVNRMIAGPVGSQVNLEFQHENGSTSRCTLTRRNVYAR